MLPVNTKLKKEMAEDTDNKVLQLKSEMQQNLKELAESLADSLKVSAEQVIENVKVRSNAQDQIIDIITREIVKDS